MKILILFALLAFVAADDDTYVLEKIDMSALAANVGEFKSLIDCLVDRGPCSDLYLSYKVLAPECIKEACKKCTVELKKFGYQFFEMLKTKLPEDYILFKQVYDPENKYLDAMETEVYKYKV